MDWYLATVSSIKMCCSSKRLGKQDHAERYLSRTLSAHPSTVVSTRLRRQRVPCGPFLSLLCTLKTGRLIVVHVANRNDGYRSVSVQRRLWSCKTHSNPTIEMGYHGYLLGLAS